MCYGVGTKMQTSCEINVNMVKEFIKEDSFDASWDTFYVDYTHHHEVNGQSYISTIDHFLWNKYLCDKIVNSGDIPTCLILAIFI